jgi:hypothetical protein
MLHVCCWAATRGGNSPAYLMWQRGSVVIGQASATLRGQVRLLCGSGVCKHMRRVRSTPPWPPVVPHACVPLHTGRF